MTSCPTPDVTPPPAGRVASAVMVGQLAHDGLICLFYWDTRMRLPVAVRSLASTHSFVAIPGRSG
jgi:hypothetical protein